MNIFEKYASKISAEELEASKREIEENNSGNYEEIPVGKYEVKVDKLEAKTSKKGNPMVSIQFRILDGKFENQCIFYSGVYTEPWMRHRVAKFLCDILDAPEFVNDANVILKGSLTEVNDFCMDIHEQIDGKLEYLLDYGTSKGYQTYAIKDVYEVA